MEKLRVAETDKGARYIDRERSHIDIKVDRKGANISRENGRKRTRKEILG